jgi:hypothetical protein
MRDVTRCGWLAGLVLSTLPEPVDAFVSKRRSFLFRADVLVVGEDRFLSMKYENEIEEWALPDPQTIVHSPQPLGLLTLAGTNGGRDADPKVTCIQVLCHHFLWVLIQRR